jgi:hypothetical protein
MQNNRCNARLDCNKTCQLHWNGSSYPATIKNLSIVAMDVHFDDSPPEVKIGDECVIYFYDDQKTHPDGFNYHVTRIGTSDIAVSILDRHNYS